MRAIEESSPKAKRTPVSTCTNARAQLGESTFETAGCHSHKNLLESYSCKGVLLSWECICFASRRKFNLSRFGCASEFPTRSNVFLFRWAAQIDQRVRTSMQP